jgi:uncharacterized membrane protein YfcA
VIHKLAIYSIGTGVLGGIVGTSGILILSILLFNMDLHPLVIANTNQYLSLASTFSVFIQFLYMDVYNFPYALYLGIFVFIGSFSGIYYVNKIIKATGRQSVIIFALAVVLFLSLITLPLKYVIY